MRFPPCLHLSPPTDAAGSAVPVVDLWDTETGDGQGWRCKGTSRERRLPVFRDIDSNLVLHKCVLRCPLM